MTSLLKRNQSKFSSAKRTREFKRAEVGYIYNKSGSVALFLTGLSAHYLHTIYTLHIIYTPSARVLTASAGRCQVSSGLAWCPGVAIVWGLLDVFKSTKKALDAW